MGARARWQLVYIYQIYLPTIDILVTGMYWYTNRQDTLTRMEWVLEDGTQTEERRQGL